MSRNEKSIHYEMKNWGFKWDFTMSDSQICQVPYFLWVSKFNITENPSRLGSSLTFGTYGPSLDVSARTAFACLLVGSIRLQITLWFADWGQPAFIDSVLFSSASVWKMDVYVVDEGIGGMGVFSVDGSKATLGNQTNYSIKSRTPLGETMHAGAEKVLASNVIWCAPIDVKSGNKSLFYRGKKSGKN